jgi:hypothetical protein
MVVAETEPPAGLNTIFELEKGSEPFLISNPVGGTIVISPFKKEPLTV